MLVNYKVKWILVGHPKIWYSIRIEDQQKLWKLVAKGFVSNIFMYGRIYYIWLSFDNYFIFFFQRMSSTQKSSHMKHVCCNTGPLSFFRSLHWRMVLMYSKLPRKRGKSSLHYQEGECKFNIMDISISWNHFFIYWQHLFVILYLVFTGDGTWVLTYMRPSTLGIWIGHSTTYNSTTNQGYVDLF